MNTLREAATQALEALEGGADSWERVGPAIDALRAALVEDAMQKFTDVNQELEAALAEDVATHGSAWSQNGKRIDPMSVYAEPVQEQPVCDECGKHKRDGWALYCVGCVEPMFAPPLRKPLSEEEAIALWADKSDGPSNGEIVSFTRAIERAHGII